MSSSKSLLGLIVRHGFSQATLIWLLCELDEHEPADPVEYHFDEYTCRHCGRCIEN